ncbi:MAG: metallophosphoesterase family protein [Myxococcota bacterium]
MTRIAQLTDLHLLEEGHDRRPADERVRLRFLSFGRRLDAGARRRRALTAIDRALRLGADHLLLTGDLTEDGSPAQFEVLAQVIEDSGIAPERVTLTPGNHDAYSSHTAFRRALEGPLRPFRRTSGAAAAVDLGEAVVVPLSTAMHQPPTRSAGSLEPLGVAKLRAVAQAPSTRHKALVAALHHPPSPWVLPVVQWVDGLQNPQPLLELLATHDRLHAVHGHIHREVDRRVPGSERRRVFSAQAVVDGRIPLRIYDACEGRLVPCEIDSDRTSAPARSMARPPIGAMTPA